MILLWKNVEKRTVALLLLVLFLAAFIYFYKLGAVPNGLNQDETSIGYNAYSILKTHRDEYGVKFPLYFKSLGDYKLPVYVYSTAVAIKTFGLNEFAVRFSSALFGVFGVFFFYLLVKEISKDKNLALISAFFLAVSPWHIFFSRVAFEVNLALTFAIFGAWAFIVAIRKNCNTYFFLLSVVGFVLSLYSYNLTRLLSPLLFFTLVAFNFKTIQSQLSSRKIFIILAFFLLFITPFVLTFFSSAGASSASSSLITGAETKAKVIEMRSYLVGLPSILTSTLFNKYLLGIWQYLYNIIEFLSSSFFFVSGSNHINQGIGNFGQFYLIQFPFIVYGAFTVFKQKTGFSRLFLAWFVLSLLVASLSKDVPHATRGYFLVLPLCFFAALGLSVFIKNLKINFRKPVAILISLLFIYFTIYFLTTYFVRFPVEYAKGWRSQEKSVAQFLDLNRAKYKKIVINVDPGLSYTSLIFYTSYSPDAFQNGAVRPPVKPDELIWVSKLDNYEFRKIDWNKDKEPGVLYVTTPDNVPSGKTPIQAFYYPQRPVVFSINAAIAQYSVMDGAYYIYSF